MALKREEKGNGNEDKLKEQLLDKELELDSLQYRYKDLKEKGE